jgi:hypothetical protein
VVLSFKLATNHALFGGVDPEEGLVTEIVRSTTDGHVRLVANDAGRYSVQVAHTVIFESGVLSAAEIYYAEEADKHRASNRAVLAKERAHLDLQAVRSDASARKSANAQKKGGKGGRGGVNG